MPSMVFGGGDGGVELARKFYIDEYRDSVLYTRLARDGRDVRLRAEFLRLSNIESKHAKFWHDFLARGTPMFRGFGWVMLDSLE